MTIDSAFYFTQNIQLDHLRIDTGGWSVICCALFNEVPTKCSLANYHTLYVIK